LTFDTQYLYSGGNLLVTIRHAQPQGPAANPYWSVDAYNSGYDSAIGHDANATTATTLWPYSPITEFTTAALNPDGTVPEPSTLTLAGLGGLSLLAFRRRKD
jgi:hypothetical protein